MSEKRIYEKYKGTTNEPGVIDTEFAYPIMYRLQLLYDRKFTRLTKEEFNKYYNDRSLADLVVGEAFLIA